MKLFLRFEPIILIIPISSSGVTPDTGVFGDGGAATAASLQPAVSVWGDTMGMIFVSQQYALRMVDSATNIIQTAAGTLRI